MARSARTGAGEGTGGGRATLFALSSGAPPSGVAVVRLSGPACRFVLETMAAPVPEPRRAALRRVIDPRDGRIIDRGLVLFFPGPASFTGEDAAEIHLHGGRAVVAALLDALAALPGLAPAEAGAFTRRAFENGRLDLTAVEGLADLLAAETEAQRRQAFAQADGVFARAAEGWRQRMLRARAAVEADLDFADEDDVPGSVAETAAAEARALADEIRAALAEAGRGERIRSGLRVAIMGPPNAGKSSLLNALARRDVAIVTEVPGTTRDVLEVHLHLAGVAVVLADTAGLRDTADPVEREGIRRAEQRAAAADLVLWLSEDGAPPPDRLAAESTAGVVPIRTKSDLRAGPVPEIDSSPDRFPSAISVRSGEGMDRLEAALAHRASLLAAGEPALVTRLRQRLALEAVVADLDAAVAAPLPEIRAEALRRASDGLARLTGRIDVEDVLGAIFSTFCIGK